MINRVELSARIVERAALRYTPAGLPALDLRLAHAGQVLHAGQPRQVSLEIHATAIGEELVETLRALPVGAELECTGFLGKQRNGKGVMLHLSTVVSTPPSPESY